jgi:hypothetical protein
MFIWRFFVMKVIAYPQWRIGCAEPAKAFPIFFAVGFLDFSVGMNAPVIVVVDQVVRFFVCADIMVGGRHSVGIEIDEDVNAGLFDVVFHDGPAVVFGFIDEFDLDLNGGVILFGEEINDFGVAYGHADGPATAVQFGGNKIFSGKARVIAGDFGHGW